MAANLYMGAPTWPPTPQRSERPGEAGVLLDNPLGLGPRHGPQPPRRLGALRRKPWRSSITRSGWGPDMALTHHSLARRRGAVALVDLDRACGSGGFRGVRPEVVVAIVLSQPRWNLLPMEEVAHDAIGDSPVIAVHAVMVRAQSGVPGEL